MDGGGADTSLSQLLVRIQKNDIPGGASRQEVFMEEAVFGVGSEGQDEFSQVRLRVGVAGLGGGVHRSEW